MDPEVIRRRLLLVGERLPAELKTLDKRRLPFAMKALLGVGPMVLPLIQEQVQGASAESLQSLMNSLEAMLTAIGSAEVSDEQFFQFVFELLNGNNNAVTAQATA